MRTEEFWVMDDEDEAVAADLSLGLGTQAARVLAYLLLRAEDDRIEDSRARQLAIRLGTGLSRQGVIDALSTLSEAGLVTESTLDSEWGRPPKAWSTEYTIEQAVREAYARRAAHLLDRAGLDATENDGGRRRIRLGLNWQPNGLHVPFYAAREAYGELELDVEFVHYRGSERALAAVADGDVDLGVVGAVTLTDARQQGASAVPLAVLYQRAMTVLYTTREAFGEPLTGSDQLRGRRIGMSPSTETRLLAELFLVQAGVADDVEILETTGEESAALRAGDADVVTGSFSDPWKLQDEHTVDVFTISEQFPIYGPALVVDPERIAATDADTTTDTDATTGVGADATTGTDADALERFLTGTLLGWRAGRADPTPAARHIATEVEDDRESVERTFRHAIESFADSKASRTDGWGAHNEDEWERVRTALVRTRQLENT